METKTEYQFEYSNLCSCQTYDDDTDTYIDMDYCDGSCWDLTTEDFANITKHLFDNNPTYWWRVSDLRLWNGNVSGYFFAKDVSELIRGMTVNSAWNIKGTVYDDHIVYSLSHHDAMGSHTTLTIINDEEREELGLY